MEYNSEKKWSINVNESLYNKFLTACKFINNNLEEKVYGDNNIVITYLLKYINVHINDDNYSKILNENKNISYGKCSKSIVVFVPLLEWECFDKHINNFKIIPCEMLYLFMIDIIEKEYNSKNVNNNIDIQKYKIKKNTRITLKGDFPESVIDFKLKNNEKIKVKQLVDEKFPIINNANNKLLGNMENRYFIFENIYKMRYYFNYAPKEIYTCLNRSDRTIQKWLKILNWHFDIYEAQSKTVKRGLRDYNKITISRKKTQFKNAIFGSKSEEYIRQKINILLTEQFNNYEVIVGENNTSILDNGNEIDIPIIMINKHNNQLYKIAIECNGDIWHNQIEEKDIYKKNFIHNKGYTLFYIYVAGNTKIQREKYKTIDHQINTVCEKIKDMIV
ncbi:hypothetical protein [Clostridium sp. CTA-6]